MVTNLTLGEHQRLFARCLSFLFLKITFSDYGFRVAFAKRCQDCPVGKKNSNHKRMCAIDIDLYRADGTYVEDGEEHRPFGEFWESLHPKLRWGGHFGDGNHYSIEYKGVI